MGLSDFFTFGVDVAFDAGPFSASPTWTDVTDDVLVAEGVTFSRGTRTVGSRVGPGLADLTMRNWAEGSNPVGRWTPGYDGRAQTLELKRRLRITGVMGANGVRTNLSPYPSAESGTTGWSAGSSCSVAQSSAWSASGTYCIAITRNTTTGTAQAITSSVNWPDVTAGNVYAFSIKARSATAARSAYLVIDWRTAGGAYISSSSGSAVVTSTSSDVTLTAIVTAPVTAAEAQPYVNFVSAAAGEVHYIDAFLVEQSTTVGTYFDGSTTGYEWTGTAHASTSRSTTFPLWSGHITDHTPGWTGAGLSTVGLSCSDILAALAKAKAYPTGAVLAEQLYDSPTVAYPLDEPEGSTTAGDRSSTPGPVLSIAQFGTGGTLDFGGGSFGPEGDTCAVLTRVDGSNGKYLTADLGTLEDSYWLTVEAFVKPGTTAEYLGILGLQSADGADWLSIGTVAGGDLAMRGGTIAGAGLAVTGDPLVVGEWAHIVARLSWAWGTLDFTLYLNHVEQGYGSIGCDLADLTTLWVGRDRNVNSTFDGQISHVAAYPVLLDETRIDAHYVALTGWAGELPGGRFTRLAALAGIPDALIATSSSTGTVLLGSQPIRGKTITAALNEVADSDRGSVNVDAAGALRFSGRETRRNVSAAVTLDARTDILNRLDGLAYNDEDLANDATVSRAGGATVRAVNQRSVDKYGTVTDDAEVIVNDDATAQDVAEWLSNVRAKPAIKAPTLRVSMLALATSSPDKVDAMCALDLGQRITVTDLPAGLLTTTLDLFVEGIDDEITSNDWVRTITTSNITRGGAVWILGDPTYSVLGSTTILA